MNDSEGGSLVPRRMEIKQLKAARAYFKDRGPLPLRTPK